MISFMGRVSPGGSRPDGCAFFPLRPELMRSGLRHLWRAIAPSDLWLGRSRTEESANNRGGLGAELVALVKAFSPHARQLALRFPPWLSRVQQGRTRRPETGNACRRIGAITSASDDPPWATCEAESVAQHEIAAHMLRHRILAPCGPLNLLPSCLWMFVRLSVCLSICAHILFATVSSRARATDLEHRVLLSPFCLFCAHVVQLAACSAHTSEPCPLRSSCSFLGSVL